MKVKAKKSAQPKAKMVKSNPLMRTRAFVYDLYAKCHNTERIVTNEMSHYHKCGNNILEAMRGKYFERTKVSKKDDRGYRWIGPAPDEKMIQSIHKEITESRREYMKTYTSKSSEQPQKPSLEFVFDEETKPVDKPSDETYLENHVKDFDQLKDLMKKFFGL